MEVGDLFQLIFGLLAAILSSVTVYQTCVTRNGKPSELPLLHQS